MNSLYQQEAWHGVLREVFISLSGTVRMLPMHFEVAVLAAGCVVSFPLLLKDWPTLEFVRIALFMLFLDFPQWDTWCPH